MLKALQMNLMGLILLPCLVEAASFKQTAADHLGVLGYASDSLRLEQETAKSEFYVMMSPEIDPETPCEIGVIIDKKTQQVTVSPKDQDLITEFPYTDTFIDKNKKILLICAD